MQYTPMMKQYLAVKAEYEDCILFYRLGDFYEMFFEDAKIASKELELTLTGKNCGTEEKAPMCGVPFHSSEGYITKLVGKGYKVAICEQMEDAAETKGIVKREVIRVVTPSTVISDTVVESTKNNFLAAIHKEGDRLGICFVDFSTGEVYASVIENEIYQNLITEMSRFMPSETLLSRSAAQDINIENIAKSFQTYLTVDSCEYFKTPEETNKNQFGSGYKLKENELSYAAIAGAVSYIKTTQKTAVGHINKVSYYEIGEFMDIDVNSKRNLELTETMRAKTKKGSLLWAIDVTRTAMGGRLIRKWIDRPLVSCGIINKRLNGVEELTQNVVMRTNIRDILTGVSDMERLLSKIVCKTANARDLVALKAALEALPALAFELVGANSAIIKEIYNSIDKLEDICSEIERGIVNDPPVSLRDGGIFNDGYDMRLDEYKAAMKLGKGGLSEIENAERERTGIKNLKIGFNRVFGYYIEVSKSNVDKVPDDYIRRQTLTNGERYITQQLKEIEEKVLGAEEKSVRLEYQLFEELRERIAAQRERIQMTASAIGIIDTLASLAEVAVKHNYCRPVVDMSGTINIKEGRHPVIERLSDDMFVPNDTDMNSDNKRFMLITGPNMAGKSTYMRQVAIITLMAQIGSFVPAQSATIGVVDKIFTRVGASDDLSSGQSTFMVEMSEVSYILKNATSKSLIIYDEIGRGTSTYDGLAIAWAVAEYTLNKKSCGAKTLFATHYHELIQLENRLEGVKNYSVAIKQRGEDIVFLRKIIEGGADESYGVEVAKLAGLPKKVVVRARQLLENLESEDAGDKELTPVVYETQQNGQLSLCDTLGSQIVNELKKINLDTLTPIESMNILYKLKRETESL